jgi:hypothetical protein
VEEKLRLILGPAHYKEYSNGACYQRDILGYNGTRFYSVHPHRAFDNIWHWLDSQLDTGTSFLTKEEAMNALEKELADFYEVRFLTQDEYDRLSVLI